MTLAFNAIYINTAISGAILVAVTIVGIVTRERLGAVHVLVNDRLDRALDRIESLEGEIRDLKAEVKK